MGRNPSLSPAKPSMAPPTSSNPSVVRRRASFKIDETLDEEKESAPSTPVNPLLKFSESFAYDSSDSDVDDKDREDLSNNMRSLYQSFESGHWSMVVGDGKIKVDSYLLCVNNLMIDNEAGSENDDDFAESLLQHPGLGFKATIAPTAGVLLTMRDEKYLKPDEARPIYTLRRMVPPGRYRSRNTNAHINAPLYPIPLPPSLSRHSYVFSVGLPPPAEGNEDSPSFYICDPQQPHNETMLALSKEVNRLILNLVIISNRKSIKRNKQVYNCPRRLILYSFLRYQSP
jgi:hypothetical protein